MDATILSSLSEFTIKVMQDSTNDITELCSRLDRKGVPGTPTPAAKKFGVVKCALHAMLRIALVFETKLASDPGALPPLPVAWKNIWAWMEFFHTTCVVDAVYGEMLRIMSLRVIPIAISALGRDQQLRGTIARTPGAVAILTRHWIQENMYLSQIELAGTGSLFSGALRVLLSPTSARDCIPVLDLMVAAAGDAQTIARTSIEHARNAKSQSSSNSADYWLDIHTHVDLISLFASAPIPALRKALLSQKDAVDLAVELLHILSGCPRGTVQAEKCFFPTFSILLELFLSASSLHWIVRAVEAGVLEDILRLGVQLHRGRMPTDMHADLSTRFFTLLSQMLVYRSFLRSLGKAMKKVERTRIGPGDTAILWTPWIEFKSNAERCLQFKTIFEQEIQSGLRIRSCENPKCPNRYATKTVMLCAGCQDTNYCSQTCQKSHWPSHRSSCKAWKHALENGIAQEISRHDREFLHFIAMKEFVSRMHDGTRLKIQHQHPSMSLSQLYFEMDFCKVPMELKWHTDIATMLLGNESERDLMETFYRQVIDGQQIVVHVTAKWSEFHRSFPLLITCPDIFC